jgi:hypothetical protein
LHCGQIAPSVDRLPKYCILRYTRESWANSGYNPEEFEDYQETLAILREDHGERLIIVDFDAEAYAKWLGDRADADELRQRWAESVATTALNGKA